MSLSDEMSRFSRAILKAHDNRIAALDNLRTTTRQQLRDYAKARAEQATQTQDSLRENHSRRNADVTALLQRTAQAHAEQTATTRATLREDHSRRNADVTALLQRTAQARAEQTATTRATLSETRYQLAEQVGTQMKALRTDYAKARRIRSSLGTLMRQRRTAYAEQVTNAPSPTPAPSVLLKPTPPVAERPAPLAGLVPAPAALPPATIAETLATPRSDDLTTVWGIGPAIQQRLNSAGIYTYEQLVACSPEQLRTVLGEIARLSNVEQWIEQARTLAEMGTP